MKSILVVDNHPLLLKVMSAIAHAAFPDADIQRATSYPQAVEIAHGTQRLGMALLDFGLPGCSGIDALTGFREIAPAVLTVVISASEERSTVLAALDAGARGYIPKTSKPAIISAALRLVAVGGIYVPPQALSGQAAEAAPQARALTDRQLEVLQLIAQGLANKEIAKLLRIAKDTVKQHATAVYAALGIVSRSQAARAAERRGIRLA